MKPNVWTDVDDLTQEVRLWFRTRRFRGSNRVPFQSHFQFTLCVVLNSLTFESMIVPSCLSINEETFVLCDFISCCITVGILSPYKKGIYLSDSNSCSRRQKVKRDLFVSDTRGNHWVRL